MSKTDVAEKAIKAGTQALAKRSGSVTVEDAAKTVLAAAIRSGAVVLTEDED
jgi:rRNA-processing protein FCF1